MICGVMLGTEMPGRYDATMPTSINSKGAENLIRSAVAVTITTTAAISRMLIAVSTTPSFHASAERVEIRS